MEKPSLEEVKEHFKNAKVVKCLFTEKRRDLTALKITRDIHFFEDKYWIDFQHGNNHHNILLWRDGDFAEILEYKSFKIPEKWHVVTKNYDEFKTILDWGIENNFLAKFHHDYKPERYPYIISKNGKNSFSYDWKVTHGKEITFEQFKKYILERNKMDTKEQRLEQLEKELKSLKEEIAKESEIKVGDIVVVDNLKAPINAKFRGSIGDIYEVKMVSGTFFMGDVLGGGFLKENLRKATPQEIEEFNKPKLPKIGCREGQETERHIKYGDKNLSKKCLKQMQQAGITYLGVKHGTEVFDVSPEELEQIYKIARKS